jgi:hypothetical protein
VPTEEVSMGMMTDDAMIINDKCTGKRELCGNADNDGDSK